jgi:lysozyme
MGNNGGANNFIFDMVKGIDIYHGNDVIWDTFSDINFAICKGTQGSNYEDPMFNTFWQHLKTTSLLRGAYHFLTVNSTAQQQADKYLSLGIDFSKEGCLPPFLDVEDQVPSSLNEVILNDKKAFIQLITDWINIVESKTGKKVIIYSYRNFFKEYLNQSSWPGNPLWLAAYQQEPPMLPIGWTNWTFWQYSQNGPGGVDLDYFNGTIEDLNKLANINT